MSKKENFEDLMKQLEEITSKLENEKLNLDESVDLFEQGMKISKKCNEKLANAEKKITILLDTDNVTEDNFVPED